MRGGAVSFFPLAAKGVCAGALIGKREEGRGSRAWPFALIALMGIRRKGLEKA